MKVQPIAISTDSSGAGTATTPAPIGGYVVGVRCPGSYGATADYLFTAPIEEGSGTILALVDRAGPFSAYCGGSIEGGGASAHFPGVPCDGYLQLRIAEATPSAAGTIHVYSDSGQR